MATLIAGNTYPVKDQLKALGGRWDAARKGWMVPDEKAAEAQKLVNSAPKTSYTPRKRYGIRTSSGFCTRCGDDCGGTAYRCNYE
jgi:hypothetical protein